MRANGGLRKSHRIAKFRSEIFPQNSRERRSLRAHRSASSDLMDPKNSAKKKRKLVLLSMTNAVIVSPSQVRGSSRLKSVIRICKGTRVILRDSPTTRVDIF